jgi:hypothetical protein
VSRCIPVVCIGAASYRMTMDFGGSLILGPPRLDGPLGNSSR